MKILRDLALVNTLQIIRKNISLYVFWILFNLTLMLIFSDSVFGKGYYESNKNSRFWPFSEDSVIQNYDLREFFFFNIFPFFIILGQSIIKIKTDKLSFGTKGKKNALRLIYSILVLFTGSIIATLLGLFLGHSFLISFFIIVLVLLPTVRFSFAIWRKKNRTSLSGNVDVDDLKEVVESEHKSKNNSESIINEKTELKEHVKSDQWIFTSSRDKSVHVEEVFENDKAHRIIRKTLWNGFEYIVIAPEVDLDSWISNYNESDEDGLNLYTEFKKIVSEEEYNCCLDKILYENMTESEIEEFESMVDLKRIKINYLSKFNWRLIKKEKYISGPINIQIKKT